MPLDPSLPPPAPGFQAPGRLRAFASDGRRLAAAVGVGALWAASFPRLDMAAFAWLAPGALLLLVAGANRGLAFRTAYVAGAVHYAISLSWLRHIPFPAGAYAGWVALSLFLALFPPLWALAVTTVGHRLRVLPAGPFVRAEWAAHLRGISAWRLQGWFLAAAASWVAWEMVLARLFGGFPWNLLGASQYRLLPLLQIASVTGVYGVSFLVVWFSAALAIALLLLVRFPRQRTLWYRTLAPPALAVFLVCATGVPPLRQSPPPPRLTIALVQPSIPQTIIFNPAEAANRFETLLDLTRQAVAFQPDLIVWPEASLPGGLGPEDFARLIEVVRSARVWMIFGADDVVEDPDPGADGALLSYNSAFLVHPDGHVVASYRKRRLVMFGEYIPFGRWLPFLRRLAPIGDGFQPGDGPVRFPLGNLAATTSVLICFEDNFPQQARQHAAEGVDFLLNLTNNAWFGESAAQWQHMANAVFRAIETGLPLVRCSNNGITCWIDPHGRLHAPRLTLGTDVYRPGVELASVGWSPNPPTLYRRFGDVFGWLCVVATLIAICPAPLLQRQRPARA